MALAQVNSSCRDNRAAISRERCRTSNCDEHCNLAARKIYLHAWHKTGTFLVRDLVFGVLKPTCPGFQAQYYADYTGNDVPQCHMAAVVHGNDQFANWFLRQPAGSVKFAYIMRNPFEMVISTYAYHRSGQECNPKTTPMGNRRDKIDMQLQQRMLRLCAKVAAPAVPNTAVQHTAEYVHRDVLPRIRRVHDRLHGKPSVHASRLEDFESDFGQSASQLLQFVGVSAAHFPRALDRSLSLQSRSKEVRITHVNPLKLNSSARTALLEALLSGPLCSKLQAHALALGYSSPSCRSKPVVLGPSSAKAMHET